MMKFRSLSEFFSFVKNLERMEPIMVWEVRRDDGF